jgi:hypothetical protein
MVADHRINFALVSELQPMLQLLLEVRRRQFKFVNVDTLRHAIQEHYHTHPGVKCLSDHIAPVS